MHEHVHIIDKQITNRTNIAGTKVRVRRTGEKNTDWTSGGFYITSQNLISYQQTGYTPSKRGCVFPMVICPAFRMGQYRVNDHSYHTPQFTDTFEPFARFSKILTFPTTVSNQTV